ncbi:MAG TPA: FAD binding domain-containing protein [Stellaceae bacterium]|jgi:carbon-monoxide dehydrogenase medium subunit|nr:FAD binding domain-containing protein [Stellaceae bacterium]
MKAPVFTYHAPRSVQEVIDLLTTHEDARVLGGGQSLMAMLNLRVAGPEHLIDLGRVPELVGIEERSDIILVKAMTTQRNVEHSELVRRHVPLLGHAIDHVGHQQTRNRGTVGGSICHLDPGAELPVAAAALDAVLVAQGPQGRRRIDFADFPADYLTNAMEADEILVEIEFPKVLPRSGSAFMEFNLRPADFAIVSVAVQLSLAGDSDSIERLAIAIGGISYAPIRLTGVEAALAGRPLDIESLRTAVTVLSDIDFDGDDLYPPEYRRDICGVLIERALKAATERAGASQ